MKYALPLKVAGLKFRNPFYISSGPLSRNIDQILKAEECGWGGVSIKLTFSPRPYINLQPRYTWQEQLNALYFTAEKRLNVNQGLRLIKEARQKTKEIILWANISYVGSRGLKGWQEMAQRFEDGGSHIIELNMCCPNMSFNVELSEGARRELQRSGASIGQVPEAVAKIVEAVVKKVKVPIFVKLTSEGGKIGEIAKVAIEAGAQGVGSAAGRLGMPRLNLANPEKATCHLQEQPSVSFYSGPWVKPLGLRDVYEIRKSVGWKPVVTGVGGVSNANDALEMFLLGADLVGVCTEILRRGYQIIEELVTGVKTYLQGEKLTQIRGKAIYKITPADKLIVREGFARWKGSLLAPCEAACPHNFPISTYLKKVAHQDFKGAFELLISKPLLSICSYICPAPCESKCSRGKLEGAIRIKEIKKFIFEYGRKKGWDKEILKRRSYRSQKVAVIGSGPAGLSAALSLTERGYRVTLFERKDVLGGMLQFIPSFRLPPEVLKRELAQVKEFGIKIKLKSKNFSIKELKAQGFEAIFIGIGAQTEIKLELPTEDVEGCYTALEFLKNTPISLSGKRLAVIGGGFSALDVARLALRKGAKEVFILYRRTREEMPASDKEVREAEGEGVKVMYLVQPVEIITRFHKLTAIKLINLVLGEKDPSGRRKPETVPGTEFILKIDILVTALGQKVEKDGLPSELRVLKNGRLEVNPFTQETNIGGVFGGGDVTGEGENNVITALAQGERAAFFIDNYLSGKKCPLPSPPKVVTPKEVLQREYYKSYFKERVLGEESERPGNLVTSQDIVKEASRCLKCGCGEGCAQCQERCSAFAIKVKLLEVEINKEKCQGCGMCAQLCPNKNIEIVEK